MRLKQTMNNILTDSLIFQRIASRGIFEWLSVQNAKTMDMNYYLNHSGDKLITPLFETLWQYYKLGDITENQMYDVFVDSIIQQFADKWKRLHTAFIEKQYEPLENYSMIEKENTGVNITTSNTQNNDVYGFNSSNPVPSQSADATQTTTGDADENERTLTRSGNIGVTTSAQMMEGEIKIRQWNFYESLMKDVDSILTLAVY